MKPAVVVLLLLPVLGHAAENAPVQFNRDVRPILADACFPCHGFDAKARKARLRLDIPEGALIYTAYAAQYVQPVTDELVKGLIALRPSAVVHVEPVYEHCDPSTLLGLLRPRYIEVNGYNRNLSTILHHHEQLGSLEIIQESVPGFGPNPLLAASVIAWKPRG